MNVTAQRVARLFLRRSALTSLFAISLLAFFSVNPQLQSGWLRALGIPPETRSYADAWVIAAGSESLSRRFDPLRENPYDPWGRPMNYPRVVASIAHAAGVRTSDAPTLGLCFIAVFLLAISTLFSGLSARGAWVLVALVLSPPALFAVERANLDLLIFAGVCSLRLHAIGWIASTTLFALASVKLYPAFACIALWDTRKRFMLGTALICVIYAILIYPDLVLIRQVTPHQAILSWGVSTLATNLRMPAFEWLSWLIAVAIVSASLLAGLRSRGTVAAAQNPLYLRSSLAAAAIFIGCFFLGTNFNYRMIFLLLPAAWLLGIAFSDHVGVMSTRADRYALAAVVMACWSYPVAHWFGRLGLRGAWGFAEFGAWLGLASCGYTLGRGGQQLKRIPLQ